MTHLRAPWTVSTAASSLVTEFHQMASKEKSVGLSRPVRIYSVDSSLDIVWDINYSVPFFF